MEREVVAAAPRQAWYAGLSGDAWRALVASILGWVFDGYETFALIITAGVALGQLLPAAQRPHALYYQGLVVAATLFGWAIGGVLWGVAADYIGRKPAMMGSILVYALFTGLTFFSSTWWMLAGFRLLTGLGLGGEWGSGVALVVEKWPRRSRAKGAGILQSGIAIGFFLASFMWYLLHSVGPQAWRLMYLVGVLPALLVLYLRTTVAESERWMGVRERRRQATAGQALEGTADAGLRRFTLAALFAEPRWRRDTWLALLMSIATMVAWWGVSTWVPAYAAAYVHGRYGGNPALWGTYAAMVYNGADVLGLAAFGFFADWIGRKPTIVLYFLGAVVLTPLLFEVAWSPTMLLVIAGLNGFTLASSFSWFSVYLPELYPTHVRATACSFIFNATRLIACLGPIFAGVLILRFHGIANAATVLGSISVLGLAASFFIRETRGQPLPD